MKNLGMVASGAMPSPETSKTCAVATFVRQGAWPCGVMRSTPPTDETNHTRTDGHKTAYVQHYFLQRRFNTNTNNTIK